MELCGDEEMAGLIRVMQSEGDDDLKEITRLLARFPTDPRLHFMRGSVLAGVKQPLEAHAALARAVELAPEFAIARYQLGFFELTSGEVDKALATWGPLLRLPADAYLRKFAEGLTFLIRDEFEQAFVFLREGIALNRENEPLNDDIRLLMSECEKSLQTKSAQQDEAGSLSATSVLLGQFGSGPSRR
jgi:tetratricopeptide (TPR) repeat protein